MSQNNHVYKVSDGRWYHDTPWETLEGPFETKQHALYSLQVQDEKLSIQYCIEKKHSIRLQGEDIIGTASCTVCGRTYYMESVFNAYLEKLEENIHEQS